MGDVMSDSTIMGLFHVAGYIRLSREDGDKEESDSVGNQRKLLLEYIKQREDLKLYDIYIDDGYTGLNFNRPSFQRMLADMNAKKVNCVIVKDLSRVGRDHIETSRFLERVFPEMGVRFISITDHIDSYQQAYDLILPIKNLFNEQYARDISQKVYTAMKTKQQAGEFIGAFASYGYKKSPANKNKLVIDEPAAAVVRRIYAMYLEGYGKRTIASHLNAENIPCPSEYKRLNGENYSNCHRLHSTNYWTYSTIHTILQRKMYTGCMVQGTIHQKMKGKAHAVPRQDWIVVPNTHEAIIDPDTWDTVQHLLKRQHRDLTLTKNNSIFAGFLRCGDCGRAMAKKSWRGKSGLEYYFYCGTYQRHGKKYCTPHSIPACVLERVVLRDLKVIVGNIDNLQKIVEDQTKEFAVKKNTYEKQLVQLERELQRLKEQKKSVYQDYKDDLISREEFVEYHADYQEKENHLRKKIELLEQVQDKEPEHVFLENPWIRRLLELRDIEALDREIVLEMIDSIIIYENHKIVIKYRFSDELESLLPQYYTAK